MSGRTLPEHGEMELMTMGHEASGMPTIGIVHPGEMGAAIGARLRDGGHRVVWASHGRSDETRSRAVAADLEDVGTIAALAVQSDLVLSVVPPHAAYETAAGVAGPARLLVDANAVSPGESARIRSLVEAAGTRFVDGAITGPPPSGPPPSGPPAESMPTRLFLAGAGAAEVASSLSAPGLGMTVLDGDHAASALKMSYAAWTKGAQALLLASLATAVAHGVGDELLDEWTRSQPQLHDLALDSARAAARKGWRWVREMEEIAATFEEASLPRGFHEAAARIFDAVPRTPTAPRAQPTLDDVVDALVRRPEKGSRITPQGR